MGTLRHITKNLVVTLALLGASQRLAVAQPTSTEEEADRRLELAMADAGLGLFVEARATLGRILAMTPAVHDPLQSSDTRAKAQKLDDELKDRLGCLRFEVSGLSAGVLPTIWVDENVDPVPAETPLRVNPGRHVVVAKTASQQVTKTVDAHERGTTFVVLAFDSSAPRQASEPTEPHRSSAALPPAAYVGLGVGAAGFMVGSVTGILSLVTKKPNDPRCAASQCPPASWNDYDPTQRALVRTSTASLFIGAAGLGLALGSILLHKKHESSGASSARALAESVRITPAVGGMAVSGKF
jgi:hypothetical protein